MSYAQLSQLEVFKFKINLGKAFRADQNIIQADVCILLTDEWHNCSTEGPEHYAHEDKSSRPKPISKYHTGLVRKNLLQKVADASPVTLYNKWNVHVLMYFTKTLKQSGISAHLVSVVGFRF